MNTEESRAKIDVEKGLEGWRWFEGQNNQTGSELQRQLSGESNCKKWKNWFCSTCTRGHPTAIVILHTKEVDGDDDDVNGNEMNEGCHPEPDAQRTLTFVFLVG